MGRYEKLLRLLVQTAAAILGLYIMWQALSSGSDRPWLYAAALMMMGLPGARAIEGWVHILNRVLDALREHPPEKPPARERRKRDD